MKGFKSGDYISFFTRSVIAMLSFGLGLAATFEGVLFLTQGLAVLGVLCLFDLYYFFSYEFIERLLKILPLA